MSPVEQELPSLPEHTHASPDDTQMLMGSHTSPLYILYIDLQRPNWNKHTQKTKQTNKKTQIHLTVIVKDVSEPFVIHLTVIVKDISEPFVTKKRFWTDLDYY